MRRVTGLVLIGAALATASHAKGWDPLDWNLRFAGVSSSDVYQDFGRTQTYQGVSSDASLATGIRIGKPYKLGLEARASGLAYARLQDARYGSMGTQIALRRGGTQLVGEAEWTPRRVKFPAVPSNASFRRLDTRVGVRQALSKAVRLRLEARFGSDEFIPAFDVRDATSRAGFAQLQWRPSKSLTLRYEMQLERTDAHADRYDNEQRDAAGGAAWRTDTWRLEGTVTSGTRRYTHALVNESNYRRRDQWIRPEVTVGRRLRPGLFLVVGGAFNSQTSSRLDRAFDVHTLHAGLEWGPRP